MSRKFWLLTHGRSGGFLTYDAFSQMPHSSNISSIDECHFTTDGVIVYTYLHFKNHVSRAELTEFMENMRSERNIVLFDIVGYDSISTSQNGSSITEHVGFKLLLSHYTTNNPEFKSCTNGMPGIAKGMLWRYDSMARLKALVNARGKKLAKFLETLEKENLESKTKDESIEILQEQVAKLREKVKHLGRYKLSCHILRCRMVLLDQQTRDMLLEVDHEGRPLMM